MAKYDLFLSYNTADREQIAIIQAMLKSLAEPLQTFIDRESLTLGKLWFEEIQDALMQSRAVAVFYGKNGLGRWQNLEMILAMDLQASSLKSGSQLLVIPVLLPGADLEKAPRFLLLNNFLDLRSPDSQPQLQRLVQTVLKTEASPSTNLDVLPLRHVLRNPYRGLDYFREEDAPLFFGREDIAQKLLQKIKTCPLVTLVGNSGTGKSSVVRAGLIPLLRKQHTPDPTWEVIVCIPGKDNVNAFHNLARALLESWDYAKDEIVNKRPDLEKTLRKTLSLTDSVVQTLTVGRNTDKLLLVIDQFEELITQEKTSDESASSDFEPFVELLLNAIKSEHCKVLLTIRGDYYGSVTERHARLAEVIVNGTVALSRLEDRQLRDIIEKPAALGGAKLQDGLADRILGDVAKQPGNLALLEFALTILWNYQRDGWLTHAAYEQEAGKLEGAISKKADDILQSSEVGNPNLALAALTRLVHVTSSEEEGGDTRQRVAFNEFNSEERACLEPFVKARLLVASGSWPLPETQPSSELPVTKNNHSPTLEVAHEALIRHWPKLQDALKDKRWLLLWRQTIQPQYQVWQQLNSQGVKHLRKKYSMPMLALEPYLLQGYPLKQGLTWLKHRPFDLNDQEKAFVRQSQQEGWRVYKRVALVLALIAIPATAIQLWALTHQVTWPIAAKALKIRTGIEYHLPVLIPGWLPKMKTIPKGSFVMGSAEIQNSDEQPPHLVTFIKSFQLGTYEVTFAQYREFAKDQDYICKKNPDNIPAINAQGWGLGEQPATNISWHDAECYAEWLSLLTGLAYRLPSEAEWEYAARAGTTGDFYWKDSDDPEDFAWFGINAGNKTHPVGQKQPNDFGLYDMAGNVYEWVKDCQAEDYKQAPKDGSAWESKDCSERVLRGGSWYDGRDNLRSATRYGLYPDFRYSYIGFRLAQD